MSLEKLLQRLDQVRKRGPDKWIARCPAHNDRAPSLAIRELDDGRVLVHCFAGCGAAEILQTVGMDFSDLYPQHSGERPFSKIQKPFNSSDVLAGIAFEILVAWHFAKQLTSNNALTEKERTRLLICASRLQKGLEVARG